MTVIPKNIETTLNSQEHIEQLDLSERGIGNELVKELVALICKNQVTIDYLDLYRNNIDDEGAGYLASLITVKGINLCCNNIGDPGAKRLFQANTPDIDLSDNNLSDDSIHFFLKEGRQTALNVYRNRNISDFLLGEVEERLQLNIKKLQSSSQQNRFSSRFFNNKPPEPIESDNIGITIHDEEISLSLEDAQALIKHMIAALAKRKDVNQFLEELHNITNVSVTPRE